MKESTITEQLYQNLEVDNLIEDDKENESLMKSEMEHIEYKEMHHDALENIAGYIIKRLGLKNYGQITSRMQSCSTWPWVDQVAEGGLHKPNEIFYQK